MQLEGIANVDEAYKAITDGSDDEWAVDMGEEVEEVPEEEEEDEPSEPAVATLKHEKQAMDNRAKCADFSIGVGRNSGGEPVVNALDLLRAMLFKHHAT